MNPFKYAQMMKYLTRVKKQKPDLPDVFPASQAPIPKVKEGVATKDAINRFVRANPRQDMAGGGMLVQPGFGGTRQGYAEDKLSFRDQRILDIKNFVENFKIKNERLPTQNEIKTEGKFDYQFIKDRIDAGDVQTLSTTEAKKLGRKKVDFEARTKKQKETISKKQPFVLTDGPSQIVGEVSDVTFPDEEMKNNYLNDLKKIFAQKYRRTQYKDPGVLTTKQLAEKYFGKANDFTIAKIGKMNTFFANQLGLSFENLPIETKSAETAQRRRGRIVKARKELSPREKLINTQQDNLVNQINNYYRKFPDEVIKNEKLTNAILSRMNPDGTITLKTFNSFDEKNNYLKNIAKSDVGVMSIDHITDVKLEKKNVEFPINRQLAPTKTNQSVVTRAKNLLKNNLNKTDGVNQTIVSNVINSLKDLGLRVNIDGKVYGSELTPAIDVEKRILPNMQKSINTFNLSTAASNFKINPSLFLTEGQRIVPSGSAPSLGSLDVPSMFKRLSPATKKLVSGFGGFVLPEVLFYQLDKRNRMSKGQSEKEAAAGALESGTLGAYENTAYMEGLKETAESMGIDSKSFDAAYQLNLLSKNYDQNNANYEKNYMQLLEAGDEKRADDLKKNFDRYTKETQNKYSLLANNISDNVMNTVGASPLIMEQGRENITQQQFEKPFFDMQEAALEKLKREKQKAFDTQSRQVDTAAGSVGEGFYQAFDSLTQGAKNLLQGRIIPFGPERLRPLESEREQEARLLKEMDPRELFLYNKERGVTYDQPITPADFENLTFEQPGLFAGGGIAKLAGVSSGPPPESGPNSQGLQGLMKRVRNL